MKNLSIRTEEEFKSEVENLLSQNNIPFKIEVEKTKVELYRPVVIDWGLPPFEEQPDQKTRYVYLIPLEHRDRVVNLFQFPKSKLNFFHYKLRPKVKPEIQFQPVPNPKYPIYIVSYQRYTDSRNKTVKNLEELQIPYYIVIQEREEKEYSEYLKDKKFCQKLILSENTDEGSWKQRETAMTHGERHGWIWILDDNIDGWKYFCCLTQVKIENASIFTLLEEMSSRVERVGLISHNYRFDVPMTSLRNPISINNKNYSSLLVNVKLLRENGIHWRLKYNEDVDLTLQCFSKGIYTLSTSIFLAEKIPTGKVKGGNTDIYGNGSKFQDKFDCLKEAWKDTPIDDLIVLTTDKHKDGRPHHKIDFKKCAKAYGLTEPKWIDKNTRPKTFEDFGFLM